MRIEPFVVAVSDAVLDDLRERIRRTRWPDPAPGGPWAEGADLDYLRGLLKYWADRFDWRTQERWLNRFEHRVADVDDVRVHFGKMAAVSGQFGLCAASTSELQPDRAVDATVGWRASASLRDFADRQEAAEM